MPLNTGIVCWSEGSVAMHRMVFAAMSVSGPFPATTVTATTLIFGDLNAIKRATASSMPGSVSIKVGRRIVLLIFVKLLRDFFMEFLGEQKSKILRSRKIITKILTYCKKTQGVVKKVRLTLESLHAKREVYWPNEVDRTV